MAKERESEVSEPSQKKEKKDPRSKFYMSKDRRQTAGFGTSILKSCPKSDSDLFPIVLAFITSRSTPQVRCHPS